MRDVTRASAALSWPNRITLMRLLLVAPFVVLVQQHHARPVFRHLALGIFLVMAVSDVLDGYLARRTGHTSRLGAILDPLADKTLIMCAAALLSLPHSAVAGTRLPHWVVVLIVGKDLWVIVGFVVVFLLTGRVRVMPTRAGKLCTAGQLAMVTAVLISPDINRLALSAGTALGAGTALARGLWWATGALSIAAVVSYTRLGLGFVAEADRGGGNGPDATLP